MADYGGTHRGGPVACGRRILVISARVYLALSLCHSGAIPALITARCRSRLARGAIKADRCDRAGRIGSRAYCDVVLGAEPELTRSETRRLISLEAAASSRTLPNY